MVNSHVMKSEFSLAEARVLYELAHRETPTATEVGKALGLDPAYISRILRAHQRRGLIVRERSEADGRQALLKLTAKGRKTFATLDKRSRDQAEGMLTSLPPGGPARMIAAMRTIEELLGERPASSGSGHTSCARISPATWAG